MSEHKQLDAKELEFKPSLLRARKIGGRLVKEAEDTAIPDLQGEDFLDTLMGNGDAAVTASEIDEGRDKLLAERPDLALAAIHDAQGYTQADLDLGYSFNDPKRAASVKRGGKLSNEAGETLQFKRIGGTVELSEENGEVIDVVSSSEFDALLDRENFMVL